MGAHSALKYVLTNHTATTCSWSVTATTKHQLTTLPLLEEFTRLRSVHKLYHRSGMASPPPGEDVFTHNLAIKLSRALNLVNPNDLLARRVIDIAKTNTVAGFTTGTLLPFCAWPFYSQRIPAAKSFGKFKDSFLAELHAEITSHIKQEESGHVAQPVQGIIVHDSEVLEPDPVRAGGLVRTDAVCTTQLLLANNDFNPNTSISGIRFGSLLGH